MELLMLKRMLLFFAAFVSGAAVMVLELAGSRVLAPYVGTSVFTWTSLIGLMLAALSAGYWWGGKWADRHPDDRHLAVILLLASVATAWVVYAQRFIPDPARISADIRLATIYASFVLFAPATVLLGMVTPMLVKRQIKELATSGSAVGNLYACSTIGSIVGTFLGGFLLISYFGTNAILFGLSIVIAILGSLFLPYRPAKSAAALALIAALHTTAYVFIGPAGIPLGPDTRLLADIDTSYGRFWVFDRLNGGHPIRLITNNRKVFQSAISVDTGEPVFPYILAYDLASVFRPQTQHVLMIGAGAFVYPNHFLKANPEKTMDIVEIDGALKGIAERLFSFDGRGRARIFTEDGRTFLNRPGDAYDAVLVDAFLGDSVPPFQLTTEEAVRGIGRRLGENGVVLVNVIGSLEGPRSSFLRAEYATYKTVFPYVYVLPTQGMRSADTPQNVMLVAARAPLSLPKGAGPGGIGALTELPAPYGEPVLTDDFAPVERYSAELHS